MNLQKVRSLSKYSSLVTALIGCLVIVGWVFKIELLTSIFPGIPPMRVNAALGFILSCASLWFWHEYNRETESYPRWKRSLSLQLAIVVACIASLTLIQFLFNINLGIDELLVKDFTTHIGYEYPGRIAMSAAVKFLMLSAALILLNRRIYSLAEGLAFGSFLISLLGLIGYIYQVQDFYNLFSGGSIALAAIIAFGILSLGILFARPEQGWLKVITSPDAGGITARYLLPFVISIPLILGGFQILSYRSDFMPIEVSIICLSIVNILVLSGVAWWNARFLNKLDLKQRKTELALRQSYERLENRVAERTVELTNANNCLQDSYQLLSSVIEGISDSLFVKDRLGKYVIVNSAMCRKLGKSREEILGLNDDDLFVSEIAQKLRETDNQIMELGETQEIEEEILDNETKKTYLSTKSPWRNQEGNVIGLIGVIKNVSDRKQTEVALQASEEQLRLTLEFAQIGSWAWHLEENKLNWNSKLFQLLGLDSQTAEANYETWRDRIYPEDLERVEAAIYYALENHTDYDTEHRVIYPDRSIHWIAAKGRAIYDRSGQPVRMLGVIFEITDRKQTEISLQESEERFRRAIINSPLPIILHADDGTILQMNHAWTEITGYSSEDIPTIAHWTEKAYGSRKDSVREGIESLHDLDRRVYEGEFSIRTSSGETRIWDFYSAPLGKLPDGRKLLISKAIDITERKQVEADLQQYKDIFQFAEHGLAVSKGTVLEIVNPAFARMHGYSVAEMIGKPILSLFPTETWGETISFIQELNEVGHLTHESYHVRKDGTLFPIFLDITMVKDEQGNPLYRILTMVDISDRKQAEISLQESEERLRLALHAANQGMWDLNIQTGEAIVSAEYAGMLGYEPEELQETNAKWRERLHPEERETVYQVYADYIAGKRDDYRVECRQLTKIGEWKWILSVGKVVKWDKSGNPLRMLGTHTDISERKQAEENLTESEKQLRSIMENMPVMLDAFDAEGNIIVWNQECERVTGYSAEEIMGNPQAWEMVYPDLIYRQTMMKKWAEFGNNYRNWEWDLVSKNGEIKTIAWSNISKKFPVPGWSGWGVGIDITERKQAELGIIQLNQSLEQRVKERTAELAAANKELEAFSYSVSHDLRAPLRAIDGFSKTLLERYENQLDDKGKHYLDRIRAGTQRMGELIDDMLMLSRVTRAEMKRVPVNLSQIAEEVSKNLSESQPERFVQWNIAPEITALGDAALLRIVLENLLSNAWKFTSNCPETQIEFGATLLSENILAYFVKDNGVGFDMTYVNKLFIAFQRLHSVNEFPGTGVGLAIVQRIIHRHGGNVWAEGIINQGATFYFTLISK
ncbi:MAG: PAS domain S-box protein [Phormidium sp.]